MKFKIITPDKVYVFRTIIGLSRFLVKKCKNISYCQLVSTRLGFQINLYIGCDVISNPEEQYVCDLITGNESLLEEGVENA